MLQSLLGKYILGEAPILPQALQYTLQERQNPPFELQNFELYNAVKTNTQSPASIFICYKRRTTNEENYKLPIEALNFARNQFSRIKTLRHPSILRVFDSAEDERGFYIVTEPCTPLLSTTIGNDPAWGFHQIITALHFINESCKLTHGLMSPMSIYVTPEGYWKLGSFDCCCERTIHYMALLAQIEKHAQYYAGWKPPRRDISADIPSIFVDRWGIASIMGFTYAAISRHGASKDSMNRFEMDPTALQKYIPKDLLPVFRELIAPRKQMKDLSTLLKTFPYFSENAAVQTMLFLSQAAIRGRYEKEQFFKALPKTVTALPKDMGKQILLELVNLIKFEGYNVPYVLQTLVNMAQTMEIKSNDKALTTVFTEQFKSTDRATRYILLQQFPFLEKFLSKKAINQEIFGPLMYGFTDTSPQIREATVKSMMHVVPRLTRTRAEEVSKYMLNLLKDAEPTIRTNTTICFAKAAEAFVHLGLSRALIEAYSTSLEDKFAPCRISTLQAICATALYFNPFAIARELMPAVCKRLIDSDEQVRKASFESVDYLTKILQKKLASDSIENYAKRIANEHEMGGSEGWFGTLADMAKVVSSSLGIKSLDFYPSKEGLPEAAVTGEVSQKSAETEPVRSMSASSTKAVATTTHTEETCYDAPPSIRGLLDDSLSDNAWEDDDIEIPLFERPATHPPAPTLTSVPALEKPSRSFSKIGNAETQPNSSMIKEPKAALIIKHKASKLETTANDAYPSNDQFFKEFEDSLKLHGNKVQSGVLSIKQESNRLQKPFLSKSKGDSIQDQDSLTINFTRRNKKGLSLSSRLEDEFADF